MPLRLLAVIMGIATVGGCAHMPPVRVNASPADMEMLAGEWKGDYASPALGRRGSIEFKLVASSGQAYGDVLMIPQNSTQPYEPSTLGNPSPQAGMPTGTQLLTIRFVRAESGEINGMLDPYWDPDRNCHAYSVFHGAMAKGVIEGTFTTTFECGAGEATGRWQVTRKPAKQKESASIE